MTLNNFANRETSNGDPVPSLLIKKEGQETNGDECNRVEKEISTFSKCHAYIIGRYSPVLTTHAEKW